MMEIIIAIIIVIFIVVIDVDVCVIATSTVHCHMLPSQAVPLLALQASQLSAEMLTFKVNAQCNKGAARRGTRWSRCVG